MKSNLRRRFSTPRGKMDGAQWLYEYVRCGMSHCFGISFGGFEIDTLYDPPHYLRHTRFGPEIEPFLLFEDFKQAAFRYLSDVKKADPSKPISRKFRQRFEYILKREV